MTKASDLPAQGLQSSSTLRHPVTQPPILRTSCIPGATLVWWPVIYSASRRKTTAPKEWFLIRNTRCDPCFIPTTGAHPALEGHRSLHSSAGGRRLAGVRLGEPGMASGHDRCLSLTAWTLFFMGSTRCSKETFG